MTKTFSSLLCVLGIVVLSVLLLNPMHLWMSDMTHVMLEVGLLAVFGVFAAFVLREQGGDEREEMHRQFSGRIAFLSGAFILVIGIVYQGLHGIVDAWLVLGLALMLVIKIIARWYSDWCR